MIIFAFYLLPIFGLSSAYPPLKSIAEESEGKMLILVKECGIERMPR